MEINIPGHPTYYGWELPDHWILLHLDTLLHPDPYLPPEDMKVLEWSDAPDKVHIASAQLDLYASLGKAGHEGPKGLMPDLGLLRLFLWSNDHGICRRAFYLVP